MSNHLDIDQLLLSRIHANRSIPSLTSFDKTPPFRTVAGLDKPRSLFIDIEDDPLLYQDPSREQNLEIISNFLFKIKNI